MLGLQFINSKKNLVLVSLFGITITLGCLRSNQSSSILAPDDEKAPILSAIGKEKGFREIYTKIFGSASIPTGSQQVELWPHTKDLYPAFPEMDDKIYQAINLDTKQLIDKDIVLEKVRYLGHKYGLSVYLSGMSASRVAYLATLRVRRQRGDTRISPYRVGAHFDEIFPFRESLMELVVQGGTPEGMSDFTKEVSRLMSPIIHVAVVGADQFEKKNTLVSHSCSGALIPLDTTVWDPEQLGKLPSVFNKGVLEVDIKGQPRMNYDDFIETMACLSLFDLTPTKDLETRLREFVTQINEPSDINLSLKAQRYTYAMLWEMRHIFRFRPFLKSLGWDKKAIVSAYEKMEDENLKNAIVSMIDKQPMTLGFGGITGVPNSMKFSQVNSQMEEQLQFSHGTREPEHLIALRRNPYGLPNAYISRAETKNVSGKPHEGAMFGDALYALPSWKRTYSSNAMFILSTPRTPFLGKNCRLKWVQGADGSKPYALLNHASYFFVVDPRVNYTTEDEVIFSKKDYKGLWEVSPKYSHVAWQNQFIVEELFAGRVKNAENIAKFLILNYASDKSRSFQSLKYFDCTKDSDDAVCRLSEGFREYFTDVANLQRAKSRVTPILRRPVLKSRPLILRQQLIPTAF